MSVAQELGMVDHEYCDCPPPTLSEWLRSHADILPAVHLPQLRTWLRETDPEVVDGFLRRLVMLSTVKGGDDVVAARLVMWALLPGANRLSRQLSSLSPRIDHLVASQLWIEIRTFPKAGRRHVATCLLRQTKAGVLTDMEAPSRLRRRDPSWFAIEPGEFLADELPAAEPERTAEVELLDLLDWAVDNQVITHHERGVLLRLVEAANASPVASRACAQGGLLAHGVSTTVATDLGVSARTVRRWAGRSLRALTEAAPRYLQSA